MNAPVSALTAQGAAAQACIDSRFTVPGMRCAGCIGKVERGLAAVPGVAAARVNFSARRVAVSHDPALTGDAIIEELRKLGFEAERAAENPLGRDDAETRRLLRALAVAGFGMMNIMLLSVSVWAGAGGETRELFHLLSALIAIPVIAYAGRPFFGSALMALRYRRTNMDVPISIGVLLATGMSLYETLTGGPHAYFDGAVMLLFFLLAGRVLDAMMRSRARSGIAALLGRMGRGAHVLEADGSTRYVEADRLAPGMIMLVAAGEALAADGEIVEGRTTVDSSMLTGESDPRPAGTGETIHAGMINLGNPVRVRVTAAAQDTALADIARLMDEAGQSRSRYVRIADKAARYYAPAVHSLAFLSFCGWMLAGAGLYKSLLIAVAVLIITCPCALGLAVPAAQVVAAGALMKRGLLIKDGSALERLAEVDEVLFDKTGTLTLGEPRPVDLTMLSPRQRSITLALAQASRHPLSRGLASALRGEGVEPATLDALSETAGHGMAGRWAGEEVALLRPEVEAGGLAVDLLVGGARTRIGFADLLRPDVRETLEQLRAQGIVSAIASGDRQAAVAQVARELGLFATAAMRPADKLALLERKAGQGRKVLMIGDGLNDGPALAGAHVSIAPGGASDVSQQAADAVFVGDRLMPVSMAIRVARATMRVVRQNFALAAIYNLFAVPLAIFGFVTPLLAAIAMSASSLIVVGNSLRVARAAGRQGA
ncbi:heavy metal translocating P-type ATPase [Novosphingobium pentaromativorans]|uniref:Heavy metal translocating P-type ATPase n=1 Tax=Novosphingobium pentaromativorans US6-1 TaxID=1088721 RepID=G6EBX7_9SPHN|nr:heavy metal translocating P-type ATPase [Novosphingobium pentaromativorans]AIT80231.1 nitrogen fixation protein FixI [Novosphingobium pentaromativorans US6-1]EHJ61185.1 heavy metal translocating P-type ATPase [Novosphingobium pentaromativorans US6-1]